jgi:hypothetical protein
MSDVRTFQTFNSASNNEFATRDLGSEYGIYGLPSRSIEPSNWLIVPIPATLRTRFSK